MADPGRRAAAGVAQQADLVIIGGGYMAINALEAAAYHLPKGAKVTAPLPAA